MAHISGFERDQLLLLPEAVDDYGGCDSPGANSVGCEFSNPGNLFELAYRRTNKPRVSMHASTVDCRRIQGWRN